jgi:hypothetical protein
MRHSSQVKLRHGKNCAKCGASVSSRIGSLHLGQRKVELLALSMPGRAHYLEQDFCICDNGNRDGDYRKRSKLNDAVAVHRIYEVECGSLFTLSAIIVVSCIAP